MKIFSSNKHHVSLMSSQIIEENKKLLNIKILIAIILIDMFITASCKVFIRLLNNLHIKWKYLNKDLVNGGSAL